MLKDSIFLCLNLTNPIWVFEFDIPRLKPVFFEEHMLYNH